ncbi:MAG TPA: gliding motility-associated C-terminal domain-containing protein, partial [Bacteroidia bacterium]|nr:gliding motility-associated C-terminal domain-containing protein [Bacteroidia bacterium]
SAIVGSTSGPSATISSTNITCHSACNGTATVNASGGTGAYTYSWTPSGGTAATATALCPNSYTCNIRDANNCLLVEIFRVSEPNALGVVPSQTNVACSGNTNGTATATVHGGTGAYTYSWTPSGGTAATASGLAANTYTCQITDANNCTLSQTYTITAPSALSVTPSQTNVLCNGAATGSATVAVSGGTGAYTYSWTPSGGSGTTASSLAANTYTCQITDANNCSVAQTFIVSSPSALSLVPSETNILCNGASTGSATASVSGGTGAGTYTYSWTPSGGTGNMASGLSANTYTCSVTDGNNCPISQTFTITQPTVLSLTPSSTPTGCGISTGSASVAVAGGTGAGTYTYSWSPSGGTGATASNLGIGTYTVTVNDANNCQQTQTIAVVNSLAPASAVASSANVSCNAACNGTATISASGGTGAYTYSWTPSGGTAATASGLCPNTYTCLITDSNNCTSSQTVTITEPTVLAVVSSQTNVKCNGAATGSATAAISGGTGSYTYSWTPLGGSAATASGLTAGTYTCSISDANSCAVSAIYTLTQPNALLITTSGQTNITCFGTSTGSATGNATGGTGAYTYSWSPAGGSATVAANLPAGTYTCFVTDSNGCISSSAAVNLTQPAVLTDSTQSTQASCGNNNGSATVFPYGGSSAYSYSWSPAGGTGATASSIPSGTYTCTITDAQGCQKISTVIVTQPSTLSASITGVNVKCKGDSTGSATLIPSGGSGVYTYSWNPGGITTASDGGLKAGSYTCTVTDALGCTFNAAVTLSEPASPLSVSVTPVPVTCNGLSNGSATATAGGGTAGYSYSWMPSGGTAATASGLSAGTYTCAVTDLNGCQTTAVLAITQPSALSESVTVTDATCHNANGSATLTASGGTGAYTYSWSPSGGTSFTTSALPAGTYTCTVTDANGCSNASITTINNVGSVPVVTLVSSAGSTFCLGISDTLTASGGTTYSWSTGATTAAIVVTTTGTYTVTATNTCGSTSSVQAITVTQPPLAVITGNAKTCRGDSVLLTATGGTTYSWSNGKTSPAIYVSTGGTYTVVASNGCGTSLAQSTVTINSVTAGFTADSTVGTGSLNVLFTNTSSANANTWVWNFGNGTNGTGPNPSNYYSSPGTYTAVLTVTDSNGCTSTYSEIIVINETKPWIIIPNIFTPNDDGQNDLFMVTASSGIDLFNLKIYDRWGVAMKELNSLNSGWDGRTLAGERAVNGTYYYILEATTTDRKTISLQGFFMLIY